MNKLVLGLLFISGCFGQPEDTRAYSGAPFEVPDPPKQRIVRCDTVEAVQPDASCSVKRPNATRCTIEIENPDTEHCAGPTDKPEQIIGSVWCCAKVK